MPVPDILHFIRITADPATIDSVEWPIGALVLRIAPDDALVMGVEGIALADEHAIVEDETGFCGFWTSRQDAEDWISRNAEWEIQDDRLNQGLAAALPIKLHAHGDQVLVLTHSALAHELEERYS